MAFSSRRSLASSLSHHLTRRLHPAVSHLLPSHHDHPESPSSSAPTPTQPPPFPSAVRRPSRSQTLSLQIPFGLHLAAYRSFSTSPTTPGSDVAAEVLSDAASAVSSLPESADFDVAAGVLSDTASTVLSDTASAVSSVPAPFPGEVAAAAADSFPLVAALQHLIDGVHTLTGLNWWACIALTTVLIRTLTIPLLVNQMKCMVKLNAMRPDIEEINTQIRNSADPQAMLDGKQKLGELFIKHGVTPFSPLKGLLIQGPIFLSFFFAISNMVEKVPSLKGGGAYWFTDLTTPDELFIFPVLTSLTFLAMVEFNMHDGMEGNPMLQTLKKFYRAFAVLTVPCTMGFPKAIFFYWVTSNLFSLGYGYAIRKPAIRIYLDLPPMEPQPTPAQLPTFNLFGGPKSMDAVASPLDTKGSEQSSSVLSRQIRDLEMKAKSRGDSQE